MKTKNKTITLIRDNIHRGNLYHRLHLSTVTLIPISDISFALSMDKCSQLGDSDARTN